MIFLSVVFLTAFAFAAAFVMYLAIRQLGRGVDSDSVAVIILGVMMIVASLIWVAGTLNMKGASYSLDFDNGLAIWSERSAIGIRERRIPLKQISGFGFEGFYKIGHSLIVHTPDQSHKLGVFLSVESLELVAKLIAKEQAEQARDGDAEEAD